MKKIFADTLYWAALINPKDQWHSKAIDTTASIDEALIVTSDNVLEEILNFYCEKGDHFRKVVSLHVRAILLNLNIEVIPATHESFLEGLALYESRIDKGYSLTDCISMNIMREQNITEILTSDQHFTQEGFTILL